MSAANEESLTQRQRYWLAHLRACESAGQTMQAYAQQSGVGVRSLYDAKKRLKRLGVLASPGVTEPVHFDRIEVAPQPPGRCRIELTNGVVVEMREVCDNGSLLSLLRTVSQL